MKQLMRKMRRQRPVVLMVAMLAACLTLAAGSFFALRAFAATDTYMIRYDLNLDGDDVNIVFSGSDVLSDENGYYSSKTTRNIVSVKPTTDEKLVFYRWRVTAADGTTKDFNAGAQIDANLFTQKSTSEDGTVYEVSVKAVWYKPYRLIKNYINKNGQSATVTLDKVFPPDDNESVIDASGLSNTSYDNENLTFVGWSEHSDGNGGKHMSYADYQTYDGLIENGQVPVTEFGDSTWDETNHTYRLDLYAVFVDNITITYKDPINGKLGAKKVSPISFSLLGKDGYITAVGEDKTARKGQLVYYFTEYDSTGGFGGTKYDVVDAHTPTDDIHESKTFYARWYYDMVAKFYNNHDASDDSRKSFGRIRDIPVDDPESYPLSMAPDAFGGHIFKGWSKTRTGEIMTHMPADYLYLNTDGSSYTGDFYAIWETRTFTFEYDLNPVDKFGNAVPFEDISWNGPASAAFSSPANYSETKPFDEIEADNGYTLPAPTALGYEFTKWTQMTYKHDGTTTGPTDRAGGYKLPLSTFNVSSNPPERLTFTAGSWVKKLEMLVLPSSDDSSETIKQPSGSLSLTSADQESVTFYLGTQPTREGYTFCGWSTSQSKDDMFCGDTANVTVPVALFTEKLQGRFRVTVYPVWKTNITITYDANGGMVGDDPAVTTAQQSANNVDPIVLRNYYTAPRFSYGENQFVEWNTKADGTGTSYQSPQSNVYFTENTRLYAVWNRQYKVTFDKNTTDTNVNAPSQQSEQHALLKHDTDFCTLKQWNDPGRTGYTFKGWSLSNDNDQSKLLANNKLPYKSFKCNEGDENGIYYATVYAVWESERYTLELHVNAPEGVTVENMLTPNPKEIVYSDIADDGYMLTLPTVKGYRLSKTTVMGTNPNTGVTLNQPESYTNSSDVPAGRKIYSSWFVNNKTLTVECEWKQLHRVIYDVNAPDKPAAEGETPQKATVTGNIPNDGLGETGGSRVNLSPNTLTIDERINDRKLCFMGWSFSSNNDLAGKRTGNIEYDEYADAPVVQGVRGDKTDEYRYTKTVYAIWKKAARITFDANGGTFSQGQTTKVNEGSPNLTVSALNTGSGIKRDHYFFEGWNTQTNGKGTHYDAGYQFKLENEENITLYAEWRYQGTYRIEFDSNSPSAGANVSTKSPVRITVNQSGDNDPFKDDGSWHFYQSGITCTEARYGQNQNYRSYLFAGWTYAPHDPDTLTEEQMATDLVTAVPKEKFDEENLINVDGTDYANVKLYAYWQKRGALYLHANDGRLLSGGEGRYYVVGNIYDLNLTTFPGDTPRREGYYWLGWNTKKDGSGTWYLSNKKADDAANMSRIRAAFGANPDVYRYQDEGVGFCGVNNYEGTDDGSGTLNILYAQWSSVNNFRIIFDMNTDVLPEPLRITPTSIGDRTADEQSSNPFKTVSGDTSGEKYWTFGTSTPYFYEKKYGFTSVMTYQFKGWSVEKYTPAQADEAVVSKFTVQGGNENATEDDPDIENIQITNMIPESFFYSDEAVITTLGGKEYLTVTLHAVWKTRAVVRFDANGGYRGRNDAPITEDYRLPGTVFKEDFTKFPGSPGYRRAYHRLIGYCTRNDGSGTWYLNSAQATEKNLEKLKATYGEDIEIIRYQDGDAVLFEGKNNGKAPNTLYAMWRKINNYRIDFALNLPDGVTSTYTPTSQKQTGSDSSDTPFTSDDGNGGKCWKFITLTPYARQDKYGKTNLQTYQFKGWSLYQHTADEAATAEIGYDVPDSYQDVDENTVDDVPENNGINITNKVYKTLFDGEDENVPVTVYEDENGKEYLAVTVYGVWKERAVLRLIANRNQMGHDDNDGESKYCFTGSIFKENITGMPGNTFTWKGHTFIGYNTKRDGSGIYYMTQGMQTAANNNHYLDDGWEDNAVIGSAAVFEGKDNGETPNVLYAQWVRNYALKYHVNYIDRPYDSWFSESGNDYRCNVNYDMMEWTETLEDGTSSTTQVYPYHNLRDMLPSIKKQESNNKNYYFIGWSWEKIDDPVESYDTSKLVDRAEFNDLYETDTSKWHFKEPEGGDNKYRGDIYAVWSAQPYKLVFDRNVRQSDSDTSKPKESSIKTFPTDRELSYHDIVNGYTFNETIPTATGYSFAADEKWNTSYTRKSNSTQVTGKVKNGSTFSLYTFRNAKNSTVTAIANWVPDEYNVHYGWEKYTTTNTSTGIEKDKVVNHYHYESPVKIADGVTPPVYDEAHVHFAGWKLVGSDWAELPASETVYAADGTTDIRTLTAGQTFTMPTQDLYFLAVYRSDALTVTYDPGEGTGDAFTENPVYNSSHTVKSFNDPALHFSAPADRTFTGWALTIGGSSSTKYTAVPGETIGHLTDPIVYTAQYTDILYTVKYRLEDGSADPNDELASLLGEGNSAYVLPPDSDAVKVGTEVTVAPLLQVDGYRFTGWKLGETIYAAGAGIAMPSGGATLTGVFEPIDYTLRYITNRKAADSDAVDDIEVGTSVTFRRGNLHKDGTGEYYQFNTDRTPEVPSGYTFTGWSTTRSGTDSTTPKVYFVSGTEQYHVYGQWKNWDYLVNYVTAHGTALDPQSFTLGQVMMNQARISQTVPAESGYDFQRWTINNGGGKTFLKDELSDNSKNVIPRVLFVENAASESGVATANAQWNKLYRLSFDLNGGTYEGGTKRSIDPKEFAFAESVASTTMSGIGVTLPSDLAKTDGSTFDKWQLEIIDGSGTVTKTLAYEADEVPLSEFVLLDGRFTATLKALWNAPGAHEVTYRLTSDSALQGTAMPSEASHILNETFRVAAPLAATGYTFSGWYQAENESDITASTEQIRDQRQFTMPDADVTFWGRFSANSYLVEYYDSDAAR